MADLKNTLIKGRLSVTGTIKMQGKPLNNTMIKTGGSAVSVTTTKDSISGASTTTVPTSKAIAEYLTDRGFK